MAPKCSHQFFGNSMRRFCSGLLLFFVRFSPNRFRVVGRQWRFREYCRIQAYFCGCFSLWFCLRVFGVASCVCFLSGCFARLSLLFFGLLAFCSCFAFRAARALLFPVRSVNQSRFMCFGWRGRCSLLRVGWFKVLRLWRRFSSVQTIAVATHQRQHNKALHPTAYSLRSFLAPAFGGG